MLCVFITKAYEILQIKVAKEIKLHVANWAIFKVVSKFRRILITKRYGKNSTPRERKRLMIARTLTASALTLHDTINKKAAVLAIYPFLWGTFWRYELSGIITYYGDQIVYIQKVMKR